MAHGAWLNVMDDGDDLRLPATAPIAVFEELAESLPTHIAYQHSGEFWFNIGYFHDNLHQWMESEIEPLQKFTQQVKQLVNQQQARRFLDRCFYVKPSCSSNRLQANMLDASAIKTDGLVYVLIHMAESSRTEGKTEFACRYLKKLGLLCIEFFQRHGGGVVYVGDSHIRVGPGACDVFGWQCHRMIKDSLEVCWSEMQEAGLLMSDSRSASFIDLVVFVCFVRRHRRRAKKHSWAPRTNAVWEQMMWGVVKCLSAVLNSHCRHLVEQIGEDMARRNVPSRKKRTAAPDNATWYDHAHGRS